MVSVPLILAAIVIMSLSGLPACLASARASWGQRSATMLMVIGGILGLGGVGVSLTATAASSMILPWSLPWAAGASGGIAVTVDPLSAFFLCPVFVVPTLGSLYGLAYWKQADHPENGRRLGLFYGLLAGSMALVVIARDALLFLMAWEAMALAAYFAATIEEDNPEVRRSGWVYLVATHVGTLCLFAMFALWRQATGSFALQPVPAISTDLAGALFVLAVIGFGFKAGFMPLHVWLPGAHANAPSHVSAVMSGVMLKMGVYGIVRMTAILPVVGAWWGDVLLTVGAVSAVAGIAFALGQRDLKKLLAYSSIENIGIIAMGLGVALFGRSQERAEWVVLGLGGALLHVWNHSLFKSLLFLNAGAIIHEAHTREIDQLGGLAKRMPWTMALFVVGAIAICGLPPLNGFAGEWLLYLGLFYAQILGGGHGFPAATVAVAALAMIGTLALACFVKLLGTVFLGSPRAGTAEHARDPERRMMIPMLLLAAGCLGIGFFPILAVPFLDAAAKTWTANSHLAVAPLLQVAPMAELSVMGFVLALLTGATFLVLRLMPRATVCESVGTWDCGYAAPTPRMQYSSSSFGQSLVHLFSFLLFPRRHRPILSGYFPGNGHFKSDVPDVVLDRLVLPLFHFAGRHLPRLRVLQQGQIQTYVLYIMLILIALLVGGKVGLHP